MEEWEEEEEKEKEEKETEEEKEKNKDPLVITVGFLAKPWPRTVNWYSDLGNGTRLPLEEEVGLEYEQGGVEATGGQGSNQLATTLAISNLTHNLRQQAQQFNFSLEAMLRIRIWKSGTGSRS
jgi:hypothetical protein